MSNHTLGIRTKLSHVTNVISTYVDGSEQFLFDILWPHHEHRPAPIARILSAYTGVGIKITNTEPLLYWGISCHYRE